MIIKDNNVDRTNDARCVPRADDLADGVRPGGLALDLDGEDPEEQDLDAGACTKGKAL